MPVSEPPGIGLVRIGRAARLRYLSSATRAASMNRPRSPYLDVAEVAERLRCSTRTIHELTRHHRIPHRKLPGGRRILFLEMELQAWEDGAGLETVERSDGGRVVRPTAGLEETSG